MERKPINSSLRFVNYIVNSVRFNYNKNQTDNNKVWKMTFNFNNVTKINEEKNKMEISLSTDIFKDVEDAPFNMSVEIIGFFELDGDDDISHYEANAIAIMYPYLRAIISTYTSSANVMPIILPAININAVLNNKSKDKQEN
ncbi:MAG: protein-export chaperone SecB [Bacilli bacterium]